MPTNRKRHTITETEQVERALAPLREHGIAVNFTELVIRGAEARLQDERDRDEDEVRRRELREQFVDQAAERFDLSAALAVREHGWTSA